MKLINETMMNILGSIQADKKSYNEVCKLAGLNKHNIAIYLKELVRLGLATREISNNYPVRVYYKATDNGVFVFTRMAEIYTLIKDYNAMFSVVD